MSRADDLARLREELPKLHNERVEFVEGIRQHEREAKAERVEFVNQIKEAESERQTRHQAFAREIAEGEKERQAAERPIIAERKGNVSEMLAGFRAENKDAHRAWYGGGK